MNQITFDRPHDQVKFTTYWYVIGIVRKPEGHIILLFKDPAGFDKWHKLDTTKCAPSCLDGLPASESHVKREQLVVEESVDMDNIIIFHSVIFDGSDIVEY